MNEKKIIEEPIQGVAWRIVRDPKSEEFHKLAKAEGFHKLDVDDCSHPRRLAKVVERGAYTFVVVKALQGETKADDKLTFGNVDFFVKPESLVAVEQHGNTTLERAVKRLKNAESGSSSFYVLYTILDEIVDAYLLALDGVGEAVNALENQALQHASAQVLQHIMSTKRSLGDFRRNASFMREAINALLRNPHIEKHPELLSYFRDIYDHTVQVIEFIETYRDLLTGALEVYISATANRTNEIVKVLTVYSVAVLPPVVISSFYGMNIRLPFAGYFHAAWLLGAVMAGCVAVILAYFRKREWL